MRRAASCLLLVAGLSGLAACRNAPPAPSSAAPAVASAAAPAPASTIAAAPAPAAGQHQTPGLRLDDGRRWKANPETVAGVARMKTIAATVNPATTADAARFRSLGDQLQAELEGVIAACTMTGEAHEQLHAWLIPTLSDVARLREAPLEDARAAAVSVNARIEEFGRHFE